MQLNILVLNNSLYYAAVARSYFHTHVICTSGFMQFGNCTTWFLSHVSTYLSCYAYVPKVHRNLRITAERMASYDRHYDDIPFCHIVIGRSQAYSGARIAIITVPDRDLTQAQTVFEFVNQTQAPMPRGIDGRGTRYATCYWMQPRPDQVERVWRVA